MSLSQPSGAGGEGQVPSAGHLHCEPARLHRVAGSSHALHPFEERGSVRDHHVYHSNPPGPGTRDNYSEEEELHLLSQASVPSRKYRRALHCSPQRVCNRDVLCSTVSGWQRCWGLVRDLFLSLVLACPSPPAPEGWDKDINVNNITRTPSRSHQH